MLDVSSESKLFVEEEVESVVKEGEADRLVELRLEMESTDRFTITGWKKNQILHLSSLRTLKANTTIALGAFAIPRARVVTVNAGGFHRTHPKLPGVRVNSFSCCKFLDSETTAALLIISTK